MDTLSLTDLNLAADTVTVGVESVPRNRLFFDRYRYVFKFVLHDLYCVRALRYAPDVESAAYIALQRYEHRQDFRRSNFNSVWSRDSREVPDELEVTEWKTRALTTLAGFLKTYEKNIKLVIYGNTGYLYTNQIDLIQLLVTQIPELTHTSAVTESVVTVPSGCIQLQASDYQYRSFLTAKCLGADQRQQVAQFLLNQQSIRLSPSLKNWCIQTPVYHMQYYTERFYFIDHNDSGPLIMLQLIDHGLVRKTMSIMVVNNTGD
jgi:hypothetical protein